MYTFDLQPLLFAFLILAALIAGGAILLDRRLGQRAPAQAGVTLFWSALNDAPFGVLSVTPTGELRFANSAARRLLRLDAAAVALPETDWADRLLDDVDAIRRESNASARYRLTPAPDRFVRWCALNGGELVFLFDASEDQRASQASRLLINDLSHELRTPLATILTHADVQGLPNLPEATRAESQRLLKEEVQRAARLVNAMLEMGRLETSGELAQRPVDLTAIAEAAVQQMAPQAEARAITLSMEADFPLPAVLGEADQLMRVFLNLLDNAVKFSRPGDRVVALLRADPLGVCCSVRDSGPGIPPQHLPFITRRFYRVGSPEQTGSGLGLAMVEEILRRHGSALQIESRTEGDSTGVCARFTLAAAPVKDDLP